ncbi:MAG: DUF1080 domain-containing protein [Planctomycetota bacterium]
MRSTVLVLSALLAACASPSGDSEDPDASAATGPIALFDGTTLDGWFADVPDADENADLEPSFVVENGLLVSRGTPQGHLITEDSYGDYRLTVEYRWPGEGGNCGVLVHCSALRRLYGMFPQSIECQLQSGNAGDFWCIGEDIRADDMETRRGPDPAEWGGEPGQRRRIANLTDDSEAPIGSWNVMVIECRGTSIDVWVNGDPVNQGYDCTATSGRIALQAEGTRAEFRRIELEQL